MDLAKEKEALERNLNKANTNTNPERRPESSGQNEELKEQMNLLKQREAEYHRTIMNFEEHHANLNRTIRIHEENLSEIENKLATNDAKWKAKL